MTANPIDLVIVDDVDVSKSAMRGLVKARTRLRLATVSEVRSTDLAGQYGIYVDEFNSNFDLDTADTTTADDGATCLVSHDGYRFKLVSVAGALLVAENLGDLDDVEAARAHLGLSKTAHGVLLGNGNNEPGVTAAMTDGQVLVGQTGADPLPKTMTGDGTMSAAGALTVSSIGGVPIGTAGNTIPKNNSNNTLSGINTLANDLLFTGGWLQYSTGWLGIGIGTDTPEGPLHIRRTNISPIHEKIDDLSSGPTTTMRKARGTPAAKTAVIAGDTIIPYFGQAWDGSAWVGCGIFRCAIDGTVSAGQTPTRWEFYTFTAGGANTEKMRIDNAGNVGIGLTAPSTKLDVGGLVRAKSYTVATLPAGVTGAIAYASNLRVFDAAGVQQGAGAGTGGYVVYNGSAWKNLDAQSVTAAA